MALTSCAIIEPQSNLEIKREKILVRVTYYWSGEDGIRVGTRDNKLVRGSCAADYKLFSFGTKLHTDVIWPWGDNFLIVHDTGGAVICRKACIIGKTKEECNAPVIDVFVSSREAAKALIKQHGHYIYIYK